MSPWHLIKFRYISRYVLYRDLCIEIRIISWGTRIVTPLWTNDYLGLYSLSRWMSYYQTLWSLEGSRLGFNLFKSLWNLTGTLAAPLFRCLPNFRMICSLQHPILRFWDFMKFSGKMSSCLVHRGPEIMWNFDQLRHMMSFTSKQFNRKHWRYELLPMIEVYHLIHSGLVMPYPMAIYLVQYWLS